MPTSERALLRRDGRAKLTRPCADVLIVKDRDETGILAALRREPQQAVFLFKLTAITAVALVAWDVLAPLALPVVAVKTAMVLLLLAYGAAMSYYVAKIMTASGDWAAGSRAAVSKLSPKGSRHKSTQPVDLEALRRRPEAQPNAPESEMPAAETAPPSTAAPSEAAVFNESYFLMRLQEQVKDARRDGHEMSVAAIHVTLPGLEMTPELAEDVAYEMARLASGQARVMSPPLAMNDCEFIFSLPQADANEMRQFVRELVRAFGEYWCFFGIASFPQSATTAQDLVEKARAACETSLQSGKRNQVEYASA
jgi:GGDEF domain-containing protein